jgi:pimeloyl-ACP methyl ester carboxylesterase
VVIICLHGMGRTRFSMAKLARHLRRAGHTVHLFGYPRRASLSHAARKLVTFLKEHELENGGPELGFVGHSAGGVLLRYLAAELPEFSAGRSVALGSPIAGSVIAQHYASRPWMKVACGPILLSLHPDEVEKLPPPPCSLAAVAGTGTAAFLPASILMAAIADGRPSDSTVLVEETQLATMHDWTSVPVIHTLLPSDPRVHKLVRHYLETGRFEG